MAKRIEFDEAKILAILREQHGDDGVQLLECEIGAGVEAGENFATDLKGASFRARKPDGSTFEGKWVAKVPLYDNPQFAALNKDKMMEEKEISFYSKLLPQWRELIKERNADISLNFASCPHSEIDEDGFLLVLQDLREMGFRAPNNKEAGLSAGHALLVAKQLATFHAVAYAYFRSYPGGLSDGLRANATMARDFTFLEMNELGKKWWPNAEKVMEERTLECARILEDEWKAPLERALKSFREEHAGFFSFMRKLVTPKESEFCTLCHGDSWFNNMLFK